MNWLQMRILVPDDRAAEARELLTEAELGRVAARLRPITGCVRVGPRGLMPRWPTCEVPAPTGSKRGARKALSGLLEGGDVGGSVAVFVDGEPVVDVWGGYADASAPPRGSGTRSSTSGRSPRR